jgi:hypothetical protein
MLILECSQGCYVVKNWPGNIRLIMSSQLNHKFTVTNWRPLQSSHFYIYWIFRNLFVMSWSNNILVRGKKLTRWPWPLTYDLEKSIGFQILLRTKYVPRFVKIHWRMLNLVFTRMLFDNNLTWWSWSLTLKINGFWPNLVHA